MEDQNMKRHGTVIVACVAGLWLSGCAENRPMNAPESATAPVQSYESDAMQAWDDRPPAPGVGKEHAPMAPLSTDQAIAAFKKRIAKNPNDAFALTVLGRLHLRRAKTTGNI